MLLTVLRKLLLPATMIFLVCAAILFANKQTGEGGPTRFDLPMGIPPGKPLCQEPQHIRPLSRMFFVDEDYIIRHENSSPPPWSLPPGRAPATPPVDPPPTKPP